MKHWRCAALGATAAMVVGGVALGAVFIKNTVEDAYEETASELGLDVGSVIELQNGRPLGRFLTEQGVDAVPVVQRTMARSKLPWVRRLATEVPRLMQHFDAIEVDSQTTAD